MKIYKIAAVDPGKVKMRITLAKGQVEVEVLERGPNVECDEKMEEYISNFVANSLGTLASGPIKIRFSADGLREMQGQQAEIAVKEEEEEYVPPMVSTEGPLTQ